MIQECLRSFPSRRVELVSTENLGSAHARNLAIERSKGVFLLFLDSDDTLVSETLEEIIGMGTSSSEFDAKRFGFKVRSGQIYETEVVLNDKVLLQQRGYWRYLYRRDFLVRNQVKFLPTFLEAKGFYILDDWYFLVQFLASKPRIQSSELILYSYNDHAPNTENDLRYVKQISLEHNAYKAFALYLEKSGKMKSSFVAEALYSRAYMICKLLNPRPRPSSRIRLLIALVSIVGQIVPDSKGRFYLRVFYLTLRTLY